MESKDKAESSQTNIAEEVKDASKEETSAPNVPQAAKK